MWLTRRRQRLRGLLMVELALILPLVLMLTFAVIEYGWCMWKQQELNNAARQGARRAALSGRTAAEATADIATLMGSAGMAGSGYTVTITPADPMALDPGDLITVEIDVDYDGNLELVNFPLIPVPATLHAEVTMAREGA